MRNSEVIKKVGLLKAIKPQASWSSQTRSLLLSQIVAQGVSSTKRAPLLGATRAYGFTAIAEAYAATIGVLVSRPRNAFFTTAAAFGLAVFAVVVAQSSLPGQPLYQVKQTSEDIQVALTPPADRSALELSLIDRRIKELEAVSAEEGTAKDPAIVDALVQDVSKKFESVEKNLTASRVKEDPKKAVGIASLVKEKSQDYRRVLAEKVVSPAAMDDARIETISNAVRAADKANSKALEVLVDKGASVGVSETELAAHLTETIEHTESLAKDLRQTVKMAGLVSDDQKQETLKKSQDAQVALDEAKKLIEQKDYKIALLKVTEGKELVDGARRELAASVGDTKQEGVSPEEGDNASSTSSEMKIKLVF
ncbi:hypothetical protein HY622_03845 [Candidatus Uhrbacteria bacterium]|nr:hypothetical protein [Candidatus Uhrbacteria bacterium]